MHYNWRSYTVLPESTFRWAPVSKLARDTAEVVVLVGNAAVSYRDQAKQQAGGEFARIKLDGTIVTEADIQGTILFASELNARMEGARYYGEEDVSRYHQVAGLFIHPAEYESVLHVDLVHIADTINNTEDYANDGVNWDVSVGTLRNGKVVQGVVYAPQDNNILCVAELGRGTFLSRGTYVYDLKPVVHRKWNGKLSDLFIGHGYTIHRDRRYRRLWDFICEKGIKTREIISTSRGLIDDKIDLYIHGFTFGHDVVGGMAALLASGRSIQLFREDGNGPQLLPELDERFFNLDRRLLCTEVIGGDRDAVEFFSEKWLELVGNAG